MKRFFVVILAVAISLALVLPAAAQVDFEGQITGRLQDIEGDGVDQEAGFNEALLNLQIYGEVASGVYGYAEIISSQAFTPTVLYELYLVHSNLLPMADLKFGQFELNFGDQRNRRTHNANVQTNSLIGNAVIDPAVVQTGIELSGQYAQVAWSLGLTNGVAGSEFREDRDMAITAKLWGELLPGLTASASYYTVEHEEGGGVETNFGWNNFAVEGYNAGVNIAPGIEATAVDAFQIDLTYDLSLALGWPAELYFNYGQLEFTDVTDTRGLTPPPPPDFAVDYFTVEARYNLTPVSYLAARFSQADIEEDDGGGREVDRLQIGLGHQLAPNTLVKLEYVSQDPDDDPSFDGVAAELSISFYNRSGRARGFAGS